MGNKTRGICDIDVGGAALRLHFTANAMCELEDKANKGFLEFMADFQAASEAGKMRLSDVRLMFWAGLIEHQPETTIKDAGRIITDLGGIEPAMEQLRVALELAMPGQQSDSTAGSAAGNAVAAAA